MPEVNLHQSLLLAYSTKDEGNMDDRFSERSVVMQNRRKFYNQYGINPRFTIEGRQVHGNRVLALDSENSKMWYGLNIPGVDGFVTDQKDVNIIIKVADCIPVVLFDPVHQAVGLLHAGWQGTVKRIHEKGLRMLQERYGTDPADVLVWLGPGAHNCCYTSEQKPNQIEEEVWSDFIKEEEGKWQVDLTGFIKQTLRNQGIKAKNIQIDSRCTIDSDEFFSHTRSVQSDESEGRFIVLVQLR